MADKKATRGGVSRPTSSFSRSQSRSKSRKDDILSREEEYKQLNAELEKRTASLVKEAESVISQQRSLLEDSDKVTTTSLLDNISTDDFLNDFGDDEDVGDSQIYPNTKSKPPVLHKSSSAAVRRSSKPPPASVARSQTSMVASRAGIDGRGSIEVDELHSAVEEIENKMSVSGSTSVDIPDDIMPSAAQDMGAEAQIRFLKAKARVMQEEMERLSAELAQEKEQSNKLTSRIKELEDERNKLARTNATQQTQLDKQKKAAEDERNKSDQLAQQLSAVKKEMDEVKRSQKQQLASQSAADVRLNRALEEVEKYKLQLGKVREEKKSTVQGDKHKIDSLLAENKKLEKQKSELMAGFKKQLKLIDILKRQKMHMEAARMLAFTEEEFVKALEWGN